MRSKAPVLCDTCIMVHEMSDLAKQENLKDILPNRTPERAENMEIFSKAQLV